LCDAIGINDGSGHLVTLLGASGDRFDHGLGGKRRGQPVCGENVLRKSG